MKIEKFHYGVNPTDKGNTEPMIIIMNGEGCGLPNCHCSDGYSISLVMPKDKNGRVEGMICKFDSKREMRKCFK